MADEDTLTNDNGTSPTDPSPTVPPAVKATAKSNAPTPEVENTESIDSPADRATEPAAVEVDAQSSESAEDQPAPVVPEAVAPEDEIPTGAPDSVEAPIAADGNNPATESPDAAAAEPEESKPAEPTKAKRTRKSTKATAEAPAAEPEPTAPDGEIEEGATAEEAPAAEEVPVPVVETKRKWYVVKIQSGREDSIKAAIERKVRIEGLKEFFGQIAIPVEEYQEVKKVTEKKNGERVTKEKKVLKHRKKFPGYLFAEVEFNDRILYLFRDISGVGDFVGASMHRAPTPMTDKEVQSMLTGVVDKNDKKKPTKQVVKLDYEKGDKVRIRDGAFANMEGEVKSITEQKEAGDTPKVTVTVTIFGRPVEVELDYWHVDKS